MLHDPSKVKLNLSTPVVTGYALALSKASAAERAFVAARLVLGEVALVEPRTTQAARLARTSVQYVKAALEILQSGPQFESAVCQGQVPLFEGAVLAKNPTPSLTDMFLCSSSTERAAFAKAAGPAALWDELIAPNI